jgi:hypothetical protein
VRLTARRIVDADEEQRATDPVPAGCRESGGDGVGVRVIGV